MFILVLDIVTDSFADVEIIGEFDTFVDAKAFVKIIRDYKANPLNEVPLTIFDNVTGDLYAECECGEPFSPPRYEFEKYSNITR